MGHRLIHAAALAAAFGWPALAAAAGPPPGERLLARLVRDLGSEDFETRLEADARLRGHFAAADLLEQALWSRDAEARGRAKALLDVLDVKRCPEACRRLAGLLKEGRFDLLPDHLLRWGEFDRKDVSLLAAAAAFEALQTRACPHRGWPAAQLRGHLADSLARWRQRAFKDGDMTRRSGDDVEIDDGFTGLLVGRSLSVKRGSGQLLSTGPLRVYPNSLHETLVVANGDVSLYDKASTCIIISDGVVSVDTFTRCIVIARNGIKAHWKCYGSILVSGGKVEAIDFVRKENQVVEDARRPFGVRFFEASDVGLKLAGVTVKVARPDSPLAAAGLREGDSLLGVDGVPAKDGDALRRLLRRRYAIGGVGTFAVKRGEETLTLHARLDQ